MANYVFNSSSSGEKYNAKCLNVSDDSEWTPSAAEYPQDGTIDLSGGVAGRYLDTQWIAPQDEEWTMSGIYNVVMGVSYDMYSIYYKGNQTCDIYLGSDTEDLVLSESDKPYTPPTGNWLITEEPPAIIIPDTEGYSKEVYVNIYTNSLEGTTPGVTINTILYNQGSDAALVDKDNVPSGFSIKRTTDMGTWYSNSNGIDSGDDSYVMYDEQMASHVYSSENTTSLHYTMIMSGLDDAKTYTIEATGSSTSAATRSRIQRHSITGHADQTFDVQQNTTEQSQFTGVSPSGGIINLICRVLEANGDFALNGVNIKEET